MKSLASAGLACALAIGALGAIPASAQSAPAPAPAATPAPAAAPAARAADVASVDAIVAALYDVISGPAGAKRDWPRMQSLFAPEGRMVVVGARPGGAYGTRVLTVDDYIARTTKPFSENGFFESELAHTVETFGQIAHVFSTYEARHAAADAKPFMRGINSIQLYHDGARWWIQSVMWRAEDDKLKLPERYLQNH